MYEAVLKIGREYLRVGEKCNNARMRAFCHLTIGELYI